MNNLDKRDLDNHITGHWGEDQIEEETPCQWEVDMGGSVIVTAIDKDEAMTVARERADHDSDWANIRHVRKVEP